MADTAEPAKEGLIQAFLDALRADDYQKMQESLDAFNYGYFESLGADQLVLLYQYEFLKHSNVQLSDLTKLEAMSSFYLMASSEFASKIMTIYGAMASTLSYQQSSEQLPQQFPNKVDSKASLQALEELFKHVGPFETAAQIDLTKDEQIALLFFFLKNQNEIIETKISPQELKKLITYVVNRYDDMTQVRNFTSNDWVFAVKQEQQKKQQLDAELQALGEYYAKKLTIILDEISVIDDSDDKVKELTKEQKKNLKDSVMSNSELEVELREKLSNHALFGGKFQRYYDNLSALHQCQEKLQGKTVIDDDVSGSVDIFVTKVKDNKPSKTAIGFIDKIVQLITLGVKGYYTPPWKTAPSAEGLGRFKIFKEKADAVRPDDSVKKPGSPGASS